MISKTRKIVDSFLLVIVAISALFVGQCYLTVQDSKDCNVLLEYNKKVVTIFGKSEVEAMGSGVLISSDGWILTAGHCLRDSYNLRVTLPDGQSYKVDEYLVPKDPNVDFGLIKLPINVNKFRPLSDSNNVSGWIYAIGTSNGVWDAEFHYGTVYNPNFKRRAFNDCQYILAKMVVQHGCSGGGVYKYGRLIGIVVIIPDNGGTLIVPSSVVKSLRDTCETKKVVWKE